MYLDAARTEFFYSKDFTTDSARFYRRTLAAFLAWAEGQGIAAVADITTPLLRRYVVSVKARTVVRGPRRGQPLTGVSVSGYANALRTFLNFCVREDWLDERVVRRFEMPRKEKKVLQILSTEQVRVLFRACELGTQPERDRALLSVLLETGIRVAELCKLRVEDVHFETEAAWLKIQGKGRREREVPLGRTARLALHRYLHHTRRAQQRIRHAAGHARPVDAGGRGQAALRAARRRRGAPLRWGAGERPHHAAHVRRALSVGRRRHLSSEPSPWPCERGNDRTVREHLHAAAGAREHGEHLRRLEARCVATEVRVASRCLPRQCVHAQALRADSPTI